MTRKPMTCGNCGAEGRSSGIRPDGTRSCRDCHPTGTPFIEWTQENSVHGTERLPLFLVAQDNVVEVNHGVDESVHADLVRRNRQAAELLRAMNMIRHYVSDAGRDGVCDGPIMLCVLDLLDG